MKNKNQLKKLLLILFTVAVNATVLYGFYGNTENGNSEVGSVNFTKADKLVVTSPEEAIASSFVIIIDLCPVTPALATGGAAAFTSALIKEWEFIHEQKHSQNTGFVASSNEYQRFKLNKLD